MRLTPENQAQLEAWQKAASGVRQGLLGQGGITWQQARGAYVDAMEALLPAPPGVAFEAVSVDGVPTLLLTPDDLKDNRVLFPPTAAPREVKLIGF